MEAETGACELGFFLHRLIVPGSLEAIYTSTSVKPSANSAGHLAGLSEGAKQK